TLPELGELAADLRFDDVAQQRAAILIGERDRGAALGKAGDAAFAFAGDAIAVGRIEVGEPHFPLPARLDGADLDGGDCAEFRVGVLVERLAARYAAFQ